MAEEKKGQNVEFIEEDLETLFTDVVQINITNESVAIDLSLRNKDGKTAKVTHRVYMTVPHFNRFAGICKKLSDELIEKLEEYDGSTKT